MDLSKLPKLSGRSSDPTESPPPQAGNFSPGSLPPTPSTPHPESLFTTPGGAFVSGIIGVIFIFLGLPFLKWLLATATGQTFVTGATWTAGPRAGEPVGYWELMGDPAWTDCAMFIFGFASIIDALATLLALRIAHPSLRVALAHLAFAVTAIAVAVNAVVCVKLFSNGVLPLFSLLAVAFGGYVMIDRYPLLFGRRTGSARY